MHKILIIEDDLGIQEFLKELLLDSGFNTELATDGLIALSNIKKSPPDLIILDLGLPKMSGETVCQEIKKKHPDVPIIILTAKGESNDIVNGLNLGADDYVTKPFVAEELLARVKARLRNNGDTKLHADDLELDSKTFEVSRASNAITLSPHEFKLLEYLLSNKGRVVTREMILNRVWSYSYDVNTRVVDVYMGYLRKKIDSQYDKKLIHSVRGFGYMIKD